MNTRELPSTTRFTHAERIAAREIGDRAVIIVIDKQEVKSLNPVGSFVWKHLPEGTLADTAKLVAQHYRVTEEQALADVVRFATELEDAGALQRMETSE